MVVYCQKLLASVVVALCFFFVLHPEDSSIYCRALSAEAQFDSTGVPHVSDGFGPKSEYHDSL